MADRRAFMFGSAAIAGISVLPFRLNAADNAGDPFAGPAGDFTVFPISHASIVLTTTAGVIYVDPVGDPSLYAGHPKADMVLITHEHGDHFNTATLEAVIGTDTAMVTNPAVKAKLTRDLDTRALAIGNGDRHEARGLTIDAIPAYNMTEERKRFHPQGRDNGYILDFDGFRIYISGDTEDIPEMRALPGIDLAFVCMNLPFTMSAEAAASAVAEFRPRYVYPYHYRGRDGGTQDPEEFAKLVGDASKVKLAPWYR